MRPRRSRSSGRARAAAKNPRTLKLPVGCRHSSLSRAPSTGMSGVLSTCVRARSAAASTRSIGITLIIVGMPIYEYRCEECGKRSSSLLSSYSSPDPACPHCGQHSLRRLVPTFRAFSSGDSESDGGGDDFRGDDTLGPGEEGSGGGKEEI